MYKHIIGEKLTEGEYPARNNQRAPELDKLQILNPQTDLRSELQ